jgi:hypothetical protein
MHSVGPGFESQTEYRLSWHILAVFLSLSMQNVYNLKRGVAASLIIHNHSVFDDLYIIHLTMWRCNPATNNLYPKDGCSYFLPTLEFSSKLTRYCNLQIVKDRNDSLLGCCAVQSGRNWPTFQRSLSPPSSFFKVLTGLTRITSMLSPWSAIRKYYILVLRYFKIASWRLDSSRNKTGNFLTPSPQLQPVIIQIT